MRTLTMILASLVLLLIGGSTFALASGPAVHRSSVVMDLSDINNPVPVPGSSANLVINDQGATLRVHTSGLTPGNAYTVWWVIFNHPEHCSDGACGVDDAWPPPGPNPQVGASVSFAAGHVIGGSGMGNFASHIPVGGDAAPWNFGLEEPYTAEIHFLIRDHGPAIPGLVNEQISTAGAGCNNVPPFQGTYTCTDVQGGNVNP